VWSPDGQWIAFMSRRSGNADIWKIGVDEQGIATTEPIQLTTDPAWDARPAWAPNSEDLAFVSDRAGSADIWRLNIHRGEPQQVTAFPADEFDPAWSPNGDLIAFAANLAPAGPCDPRDCPGPAIFPAPAGGILAEPITGRNMDTLFVDIRLKENPHEVAAFGFLLQVDPGHLTFLEATSGNLTTGFKSVGAQENPPGSGTILCGGFGDTPIPANSSGVLIRLAFAVTCESGQRSEIVLSEATDDVLGFTMCCNIFECVVCKSDGDVSADGDLTPGDALCAFRIFLNAQNLPADCDVPEFDCEVIAADANCDGTVTPGDALAIFRRFLGGLPPEECFAKAPLARTSREMKTYQLSLEQRTVIQPIETGGKEVVKLSLRIENPAGLEAFGLKLSYPSDKLDFVGLERSALTARWTQLEGQSNSSGVIVIGGYSDERITTTASGDLFSVLFAARGQTASLAEFELSGLVDDFSQAMVKPAGAGPASAPSIPRAFKLYQSFPNPLQSRVGGSETVIKFDLPGTEAVRVDLAIYNLTGQLVRRLISGTRVPGAYEIAWDGRDARGRLVPSGVYWYRLEAGNLVEKRRLVVLR